MSLQASIAFIALKRQNSKLLFCWAGKMPRVCPKNGPNGAVDASGDPLGLPGGKKPNLGLTGKRKPLKRLPQGWWWSIARSTLPDSPGRVLLISCAPGGQPKVFLRSRKGSRGASEKRRDTGVYFRVTVTGISEKYGWVIIVPAGRSRASFLTIDAASPNPYFS